MKEPAPDTETALHAEMEIAITVNGVRRQLKVAPWTTLLDALLASILACQGPRRAATTANAVPARSSSMDAGSTPA